MLERTDLFNHVFKGMPLENMLSGQQVGSNFNNKPFYLAGIGFHAFSINYTVEMTPPSEDVPTGKAGKTNDFLL